MYQRKSNSGHTVVWNPDNDDIAANAIASCDETGVSNPEEAKSNAPVDVDNGCADRIQQKYRELHVKKHGQDSRYYDEGQ